jgi:hypothetical protein
LQHIIKKIFSPKTLKYVLITISAFLLLAVVGYFSLRNLVLKKALLKVQTGIENRTHLNLAIGNAHFVGTSTVELSSISIVPTGKDTIFTTDTVRVTIKLLPALFGRVRLANLQVANTAVYLRKDSLQTNYRGLLKPSPKKEKKENADEDLSQRSFNQIKSLLRYLPDNVQVTNAKLTIKYNDSLQYITLNSLNFESGKFVADIAPQTGFGATNWTADGFFDKYKIKGEVNVYSPSGVNLYPAILVKSGIEFKRLTLQINQLDYKNKALVFEGTGEADSLRLYNAKLAADTVVFGKTGGKLSLHVNRSFITVDSTSVFTVNNIQLSSYMQFPLGKEKLYALSLKMPSTPAQTFFNSLPQGMFNTFAGIQVKGNLSYRLDCSMDGNMPDSLQFESELKKEGFEIVKYGRENFARINGPFMHTVYENGAPFRSFIVGDENPYYTPVEQMSIHFKNAILTNEDPSFFHHHGFIPQSFRDAIVEVYKAGFKFVRGGSTISMQLVKNVYLERKKTIARKAEEALIVWLIENNHISSKERMFEVYTNIIELAPGVYGIGEGSAFYFNKRPADLTMAEAIYLSNIVPRPKAFKYGFEKDGTLKNWLIEKTNLVVRRMVQREWIPAGDTLNFNPQVQLKGPAKNFIIPADSLFINPNDTLPDAEF